MRLHTVAFGDLRRRKGRAAFLVAGLLVGVATVVTLLTLSSALTVRAQNNLETYGANIVVVPQTNQLALSYGGAAVGGTSAAAREIREADLARIDGIPNRHNIAVIAPELLGAARVSGAGAGTGRQALLMGVRPKDEFELKQWWSLDGRPPAGGREVVAGSAVAGVLGLTKGGRLFIGGRPFTVSGILRPTGSQDDNLLITELATAQSILGHPGQVTMVEVAALCSACPVQKIVGQLGRALPGTKVTALQQVVQNRMHALEQFKMFSWAVAAVIVAIEALVVFVTMMGSVNARTREIGIFRALGFRRRHVTSLILMEAAAASFVAGVLGYLTGMGISYALLPLLAKGGGVTVPWTPPLAAGALALALLVGSLASLYPAVRASRLDPTVALRAL